MTQTDEKIYHALGCKINIVEIIILLKAVYRLNVVLIKITMHFSQPEQQQQKLDLYGNRENPGWARQS